MDLYMYFGSSTPIDVLTTTGTAEAVGDQSANKGYSSSTIEIRHPPLVGAAAAAAKRCSQSRSVGEINSTSRHERDQDVGRENLSPFIKHDSPSPFRRAFSNSFNQSLINRTSLRKHQSLKENKTSCQDSKQLEETPSTKIVQYVSAGQFWRASKRLFASKLNSSSSTSTSKETMPAPKAISRDDGQISSQRHRKSRQRQRTASPPSEIGKEDRNRDKQSDSSVQLLHSSPFRSLPNAKKTLRSLMKWPSTAAASSGQAPSTNQPSLAVGHQKTYKRGVNVRLVDDDNSSQKADWKQSRAYSGSRSSRKSDVTHRVQECVKDLNVSLRFLEDVVRKDKLLMLDGSASIVLDTVLKLLLILNEKRRRQCPQGNESQTILEAYNAVYHHLGALLKFADQLVVKNETATSTERQETTQLCQALKDAIQVLLAITANELPFEKPHKNGEGKKNVTDRGVTAAEIDLRKTSLTSTSSTSSSTADWAAEDEGEARLQHLDNSLNNDQISRNYAPSRRANHQKQNQNQQRSSAAESGSSMSNSRPVSSVSTSSSTGCGTVAASKTSRPPSTLHLHQQPGRRKVLGSPTDVSNGSRSPPGSDSGIFSLNDTGGSISFFSGGDNSSLSNSSLTAVPPTTNVTTAAVTTVSSPNGDVGSSSMMFLDEILMTLKLNGASTTTTIQEKFCDQQHSANDDVETVTEEVEEMHGDTKIIRRKVITRQKVRHQSVVTTTTTTHRPITDSPDSDFLTLLTSPVIEEMKSNEASWKKCTSPDDDQGELRLVDKICYKLAGGTAIQTSGPHSAVLKSPSYEDLPPAPPPPLPPRAAVSRPISDYDNENENGLAILHQKDSKNGSETKILTNKQRQQLLMQHSASLQSFSRQTLFNGKLVKTETGEKFGASAMTASKSETFDDSGRVTDLRGGVSYAESGYARGDRILSPQEEACSEHQMDDPCGCNGNDSRILVPRRHPGLAPQPPPRPPKRSVVSSYVQLFGTGTPSNQADFRSSTLATYVHLRDRWNDHFEAHKRKAMTFQFVSTPVSSTTASNGAGPIPGANGYGKTNDSPSSASSSSSSPKISVNRIISRSRQEIEEDGEEGVPVWLPRKPQDDYQNLVNMLNVNDYLKLPKQPAVEAPLERKPLPFRANLALADINLLDEIDVKQYLVCKKSAADDGPEIRGGPVEALIVHATKTSSDAVAACGHNSNTHGHGFCYQEAFLTTYRTFVAPLELVRKLVYRYNKFNACVDDSVKKKAAKNTFSLLVRVVDDLSTVEVNDDVMRLLSDFIYRMIVDGELNFSRLLRQKLMERYKIKRQRALEETHPLFPPSAPGAVAAKNNSSILDFKASLLAEQFTFLDWYYFQKIELSEMLLWAQEQSEENSPNLTNFTEHFNKMSYWVRTCILEQTDPKERERIFAKFVKIMRHLRRLNNFNSCLALLSALDSGPIRRLDWPRASSESLNEHSSLIDSSQSFKTYRMALAESKPPCLPYIGLILQDLTFVHIGNPNNLPAEQCQDRRDVLNFAKRWQQYTILDNMRRFKAWPYGIKKNEQLLAFFNDFNEYISEDAMWEISERLKPRQQHNHIGVARRVVVSPT